MVPKVSDMIECFTERNQAAELKKSLNPPWSSDPNVGNVRTSLLADSIFVSIFFPIISGPPIFFSDNSWSLHVFYKAQCTLLIVQLKINLFFNIASFSLLREYTAQKYWNEILTRQYYYQQIFVSHFLSNNSKQYILKINNLYLSYHPVDISKKVIEPQQHSASFESMICTSSSCLPT